MDKAALDWRRLPTERATGVLRLVDASAVLPRRADTHYAKRDPFSIALIIIHQTQGQVMPPPEGLLRTADYFITDDNPARPLQDGRGWPGFAYTFYVPFAPIADDDGRLVVYRCQPDDVVSFHTHGHDRDGVAVVFQGSFRSLTNARGGAPSEAQLRILPELIAYLRARYGVGVDALKTHSDFTKPDCPGFDLEQRIAALRAAGGNA
jgi:hypothetical protein